MNSESALLDAYQEWRRLAETECNAIRTGDWGLLAASQRAIALLPGRITLLTEATRKEWAQFGTDVAAREKKFRALITELMQLEKQNSTLLSAMRQTVKTRLDKLGETGRTLRRVQRSYAPQQPAIWNSFS